MLHAWATSLNDRWVRVGLIFVGIPLTLVLGAFSVIGITTVVDTSSYPGQIGEIAMSVGGLIGLTAGWFRFAMSSERLKSSSGRYWAVVAGLIVGNIVAGWMAVGLFDGLRIILPWFAAIALVVGVYLLGATVGERSNAF
jgi:hypothetical protein